MPTTSGLRKARHRLSRVAAAIRSPEVRRRQRRERFWRTAKEYVPVVMVEEGDGCRYLVHTRDSGVGRPLFLDGAFDATVIGNLRDLLDQHDLVPQIVIDVGANIGTATVDLLRIFPGAKGFAFEPETANVELLKANLILNRLAGRVHVFEAAASSTDGEMLLEVASDNLGDHRIRLAGDVDPGSVGEEGRATKAVCTQRIDTLIEKGEIELAEPVLLWVDAQGHEAHVLDGAEKLRQSPTVAEFWPYGLRRADGYQRFLDIAASFCEIWEIRGERRRLTPEQLANRGMELDGVDRYTDLLLLPG